MSQSDVATSLLFCCVLLTVATLSGEVFLIAKQVSARLWKGVFWIGALVFLLVLAMASGLVLSWSESYPGVGEETSKLEAAYMGWLTACVLLTGVGGLFLALLGWMAAVERERAPLANAQS